jgi:hypothetical protein
MTAFSCQLVCKVVPKLSNTDISKTNDPSFCIPKSVLFEKMSHLIPTWSLAHTLFQGWPVTGT